MGELNSEVDIENKKGPESFTYTKQFLLVCGKRCSTRPTDLDPQFYNDRNQWMPEAWLRSLWTQQRSDSPADSYSSSGTGSCPGRKKSTGGAKEYRYDYSGRKDQQGAALRNKTDFLKTEDSQNKVSLSPQRKTFEHGCQINKPSGINMEHDVKPVMGRGRGYNGYGNRGGSNNVGGGAAWRKERPAYEKGAWFNKQQGEQQQPRGGGGAAPYDRNGNGHREYQQPPPMQQRRGDGYHGGGSHYGGHHNRYNDHRNHNHYEAQPEWMDDGPVDHTDTIELKGCDEHEATKHGNKPGAGTEQPKQHNSGGDRRSGPPHRQQESAPNTGDGGIDFTTMFAESGISSNEMINGFDFVMPSNTTVAGGNRSAPAGSKFSKFFTGGGGGDPHQMQQSHNGMHLQLDRGQQVSTERVSPTVKPKVMDFLSRAAFESADQKDAPQSHHTNMGAMKTVAELEANMLPHNLQQRSPTSQPPPALAHLFQHVGGHQKMGVSTGHQVVQIPGTNLPSPPKNAMTEQELLASMGSSGRKMDGNMEPSAKLQSYFQDQENLRQAIVKQMAENPNAGAINPQQSQNANLVVQQQQAALRTMFALSHAQQQKQIHHQHGGGGGAPPAGNIPTAVSNLLANAAPPGAGGVQQRPKPTHEELAAYGQMIYQQALLNKNKQLVEQQQQQQKQRQIMAAAAAAGTNMPPAKAPSVSTVGGGSVSGGGDSHHASLTAFTPTSVLRQLKPKLEQKDDHHQMNPTSSGAPQAGPRPIVKSQDGGPASDIQHQLQQILKTGGMPPPSGGGPITPHNLNLLQQQMQQQKQRSGSQQGGHPGSSGQIPFGVPPPPMMWNGGSHAAATSPHGGPQQQQQQQILMNALRLQAAAQQQSNPHVASLAALQQQQQQLRQPPSADTRQLKNSLVQQQLAIIQQQEHIMRQMFRSKSPVNSLSGVGGGQNPMAGLGMQSALPNDFLGQLQRNMMAGGQQQQGGAGHGKPILGSPTETYGASGAVPSVGKVEGSGPMSSFAGGKTPSTNGMPASAVSVNDIERGLSKMTPSGISG